MKRIGILLMLLVFSAFSVWAQEWTIIPLATFTKRSYYER